MKTPLERMKQALLDIHNQTCVAPTSLETAQTTQSCIEDVLKEVEDLYLPKKLSINTEHLPQLIEACCQLVYKPVRYGQGEVKERIFEVAESLKKVRPYNGEYDD